MLCCKNLWFQHISRVILSSVFLFSMCEWKITVLYHVLAGKKKITTDQKVWQTKLKSITINFVSNVHVQVWNGFFLIWTTCKLAITVHQREITLFYFGVSTEWDDKVNHYRPLQIWANTHNFQQTHTMHPWMYVPTFCFVQANWWLGQTHVCLKKKNYLL